MAILTLSRSQESRCLHDVDTELELLNQVIGNGISAKRSLEKLHQVYSRKILAFLRSQGISMPDAQEILQDVFIKIWNLRGKDTRVKSASSYLWTIVRNTLNDYYSMHRGAPSQFDEVDIPDITSPEEDGCLASLEECISNVFKRFQVLEGDRGEVIKLTIWNKWKIRDVAAHIGRTEGATKQFLAQSRKKLRAMAHADCAEHILD